MLNIFDLHFPTPAVQCLEFVLAKLREICKHLAGACNSNSHARGLHYLTFVCKTKQGKSAMRRVVLRKCIKRAQRYQFALKCEEFPLQIEFTTLPPKNHNLFVKLGTKGELEKKELRPQANNAQYNTQKGGGRCEESWGGEGRAAPLHKLIYEPGEIV
jgi:hypothetical protein